MFDDLNSDNSQSKQGGNNNSSVSPLVSGQRQAKISKEEANTSPVEDIFSETNKTEKPAIFQPKPLIPSNNDFNNAQTGQLDPYTGETIKAKNKTIVLALMVISLLLVAIVGAYAYKMFFANITQTAVPSEQENTSQVEENRFQEKAITAPANNINNLNNESAPTKLVEDTDGDGLSDIEENALGTNYLMTDTDGDGLFDREEVKVYKTDPLDTDTDKDGYADGAEVKSGYNPNGEGKLYNLEK